MLWSWIVVNTIHDTLNNILGDCRWFIGPGDQCDSNSNNASQCAEESDDVSKIMGWIKHEMWWWQQNWCLRSWHQLKGPREVWLGMTQKTPTNLQ
jgi:hypothetical protein